MLEALADEIPELRIVRHETNRGYGGALISGFAAATRTWVFYTDGDAQYDASELVRCIDAVRPTSTSCRASSSAAATRGTAS